MKQTFAVLVIAILGGCKGGKQEEAKPEPKPEPAPVALDAAVAGKTPYRPTAAEEETPEAYEKMWIALGACGRDGTSVAKPCPEYDILREVSDRGTSAENDNWADVIRMEMDVAMKLMSHENATVRVSAISHVNAHNGDADAAVKVAQAIAAEKDPAVRRSLLVMIGGKEEYVPEQAALVLAAADDPDPELRRAILYGLGNGKKLAGAYDKLAEHVRSDPDPQAQQNACEVIGELGDPRTQKLLDEMLVDATPSDTYDACLESQIKLWARWDLGDKAAYRRTLALIPKIERPLERLYAFRALQWKYEDEEEAKRHGFVKRAELEKALVALASNRKASPVAREAAVDVLVDWEADPKVFQAIRKTLPPPLPEDSDQDYGDLTRLVESVDEAAGG